MYGILENGDVLIFSSDNVQCGIDRRDCKDWRDYYLQGVDF